MKTVSAVAVTLIAYIPLLLTAIAVTVPAPEKKESVSFTREGDRVEMNVSGLFRYAKVEVEIQEVSVRPNEDRKKVPVLRITLGSVDPATFSVREPETFTLQPITLTVLSMTKREFYDLHAHRYVLEEGQEAPEKKDVDISGTLTWKKDDPSLYFREDASNRLWKRAPMEKVTGKQRAAQDTAAPRQLPLMIDVPGSPYPILVPRGTKSDGKGEKPTERRVPPPPVPNP